MRIRRILALMLICAGLSACGGGGGGGSDGVPPPEIKRDWNDMNWDEGRWN
ncbi:hypothetical protein NBRC116493_17390 [Aurantivibrio infirmus]